MQRHWAYKADLEDDEIGGCSSVVQGLPCLGLLPSIENRMQGERGGRGRGRGRGRVPLHSLKIRMGRKPERRAGVEEEGRRE